MACMVLYMVWSRCGVSGVLRLVVVLWCIVCFMWVFVLCVVSPHCGVWYCIVAVTRCGCVVFEYDMVIILSWFFIILFIS